MIGLLLALGSDSQAQVPDLTAGGNPTDDLDWNLGPTGMEGWFYHSGANTAASRQIRVTTVAAGSPAAEKLAAGDVILGADGTGAEPVAFSADARKSFAYAIADAEARDPATLKILRWRSGTTSTVTLTLETLGAYSATAPYNCPKSAAILEKGLDAVMASGAADSYKLVALSLLAANDSNHPDNAARQTRARDLAHSLILPQSTIDSYLSGYVPYMQSLPWSGGHQLVVLAEYYLQTGDAAVFDTIRALAVVLANGQSMFGTLGHKMSAKSPDGSPNGPYGVGYGPVNNANMPCFMGMVLAQRCGVNDQTVADGIERASKFYGTYVDLGTIPYGEHQPGGAHESNGKCSQAAITYSLAGNNNGAARYYAQMAAASSNGRQAGHTGPYFNYLWSNLGAAVGGEAAAAEYFRQTSWMLDLARRWDGGFIYNSYGGVDNGKPTWQGANMRMSTVALLTYALPLRQLAITGKFENPDVILDAQEVADTVFSANYAAASRTTAELVADLGSWSPATRTSAAIEISKRTTEHQSLLPTLQTMAASDPNHHARMGACLALGRIPDPASVSTLVSLLTDPNYRIRWAAGKALFDIPVNMKKDATNLFLAAIAAMDKPLLPLDPEDPLHLAQANVCYLVFNTNSNVGTLGILANTNLDGIDRNLLYPAIRAAAGHPLGTVRGGLGSIYPNLSRADVEAVAGPLVDAVRYEAPADRMFANDVRRTGLQTLANLNISEGVPLAKIMVDDGDKGFGLYRLKQYAGSSLGVEPDPKIVEFCEFMIANDDYADVAQQVLDAIKSDTLPDRATPFKGIEWIFPDAPSLTLPERWTTLRVHAYDHAEGDSIYTWRKVHGAGDVVFSPNGTASAKDTAAIFDGTPGDYLFEVKMSDSRGLTEVRNTISYTLYPEGGNPPANAPPSADSQTISAGQGMPVQIILTGSDPENLSLTYSLPSQPAHGFLSGTPPYLTYTAHADYSGADGFSFGVTDSEGQTAIGTVDITVGLTEDIGLAVYEPFDYPAGLLSGASGGAAVGLAGSWSAHSSISIATSTLHYGTLRTDGRSIGNLNDANTYGGSRAVSSSALAARGLLDDGATLWFSMIVGGTGKIGFALATNSFNPNTINSTDYWIRDVSGEVGSGVGLMLDQGTVEATQFRDASFGSGTAGIVSGSWNDVQGKILPGNPRLVVGKMIWGAASDRIEIYLPYDDMRLPSQPSSVLTVSMDQAAFDTLTFTRQYAVQLDEIRYGANLQSVLLGNTDMADDVDAPVPNPMGFAINPAPAGGSSITMQAAGAFDPMGVEYYFTCVSGGGNDSGWQSGRTYTDTGLAPGVQYTYTVKARDKYPALNETAASTPVSATIPALATVPDVVGISKVAATQLIANAGLAPGSTTAAAEYSLTVPAGHVISQSPASGAAAGYGSAVDLVISIGADPDLPGLVSIVDDQGGGPVEVNTPIVFTVTFSEDMDAQTVDAADFTNAGDAAITVGAVQETSPGVYTIVVTPTGNGLLRFATAAGAQLADAQGDAFNSTAAVVDDTVIIINLPPVTVPNVVDMTQAAAEAAIAAANLTVGEVRTDYHSSKAAGTVFSQDPSGGSSLPGEYPVDLVVSLGPPPDTTSPVILTQVPADGSNNFEVGDKLVAYFDENIHVGSGNIIFRNLDDLGETVIPVDDASQVFISGVVMTIDPAGDFEAGANYSVRMDPGVVADASGNPFAGINDHGAWNFSSSVTPQKTTLFTEDFEAPDVAAYNQTATPSRWVRCTKSFGGTEHGLTDKAGGDFAAADPNHQGYAMRNTYSGITSAEGVIGALEQKTYEISFDVIRNNATGGRDYLLQLLSYTPGLARNDTTQRPPGCTRLTGDITGQAPSNNSFATVLVQYTLPVGSTSLGRDFALRFIGSSTSAIIDNVVIREVNPNPQDTLPPAVVDLDPFNGQTSFSTSESMTVTFNEEIVRGSGDIILKNLSDDTQTLISVTDTNRVFINGSQMTISPGFTLDPDRFYSVRIPVAAVYDMSDNAFGGFTSDTKWRFFTGVPDDTVPPAVVTLTPADNATEVSYRTNLTVEFDEFVLPGTGNIILKNLGSGVDTVIDVNNQSQVAVSRDTVTIHPAAHLAEGVDYAIRIDPGAITDLTGNPFVGIPDDTTWNFSVTAANPPALLSLAPADNSVTVPIHTSLTMTFDEEVVPGSGNLIIRDMATLVDRTISINDAAQVAFSGSTVTVYPNSDLTPARSYAVLIDAGAFTDAAGNAFAGISSSSVWSFTTMISSVGMVFFDDFEVASGSPNVSAADSLGNTSRRAGPKWVRSGGTSWSYSALHGLVDESSGIFNDPSGEQAYAFRYGSTGITTGEGRIGALTTGKTYTAAFHVVYDGFSDGNEYKAQLVTFAPGAARNDIDGEHSRILQTVTGTHSGSNYKLIVFSYTSNGTGDASVQGHDVALRLVGAHKATIIDNAQVVVSQPGGDSVPPTLAGFDDDAQGLPVSPGSTVTYTLTFSEDMDETTLQAADFSNFGSSSVGFGPIIETSPGVFSVKVIPTTAGTLRLQIKPGASITDASGTLLNTVSAIRDDNTIVVSESASPPVWTSNPISGAAATEDEAYVGSLAGLATDADGDTLVFAKVSGPSWLAVSADGDLTGTPPGAHVGANDFTVSVSDGVNPPQQAVLNIEVINVNDAPVFLANPIPGAVANETTAYSSSIADMAVDDDGNALTFSKISGPAWLVVAANGGLAGTPANGDIGLNVFTVSVTDGIAPAVETELHISVDPFSGTLTYFADNFNRSNSTNLNASTTGKSGTLGALAWMPKTVGSGAYVKVNNNMLEIDNGSDNTGGNGAAAWPDWNFTESGGVFTVSMTIAQGSTAGEGRYPGFGIGHSRAELVAMTTTLAGALPDVFIGYDTVGTTTGIAVFHHGVLQAHYPFTAGLPDTLSAAFSSTNMVAGTPLNYEVRLDGALICTGASTWGATNQNYICVQSNNTNATSFDNFSVTQIIAPSNQTPAWNSGTITSADATEDAPYSGTLAGLASDEDQDPLAFAKVSGPSWLVVSPDGRLSGTPANDDVGSNSFVVSIHDGRAAPVEATLEITVINTNDAPQFTAASFTSVNAAEDMAYSGSISGGATDDDGDTLSYAKVSGPAWLIVAADGSLSGIPLQSDVGTNVFTVSVTDGLSAPVSAQLVIEVTDTNDPPVFAVDPIPGGDATENAAYAGSLAGSASDGDGNPIIYAKTGGPAWLTMASNGTLSGTPAQANVGVNTFTVTATDALSAPVQATLEIQVSDINYAPTFSANPIVAAAANAGTAYSGSLAGMASDVDGDPLAFAKTSGPAWLVVAANGGLSGTPAVGNIGLNSFVVSVNDGSSAPVQATLQIEVVQPSVVVSTANGTSGLSGHIQYNSASAFGVTSWHVKNSGATHTTTRKGYVRFNTSAVNMTANQASLELVVSLMDATIADSDQTISIYGVNDGALDDVVLNNSLTWNAAPGNDPSSASAADLSKAQLLGTVVLDYNGNRASPAGTVVSFSSPALVNFLNADTNDKVTFILGRTGTNSSANLTFAGDTNTTYAAPKLRVMGAVNLAPAFFSNPIAGTPVTAGTAYVGTLAGQASDPTGDSISFAKVSGPTWLNIAANGTLSGTPGNSDVGENSFLVSVSDGIATPVQASLEITVTGGGYLAFISNPTYNVPEVKRGFSDDPDGDRLPNGLEAVFGTHPGEWNAGISDLATNDTTSTFTHPRNPDMPADVSVAYEWTLDLSQWYAGDGVDGPPGGPRVTTTPATVSGTTTVTATSDQPVKQLFFRVRATPQ